MTTFESFKGVFYYQGMPFGLKNAEATYQLVMTIIFKEMPGDMIELYVEDLVVKSYQTSDHLKHLGVVFNKLSKHQLK